MPDSVTFCVAHGIKREVNAETSSTRTKQPLPRTAGIPPFGPNYNKENYYNPLLSKTFESTKDKNQQPPIVGTSSIAQSDQLSRLGLPYPKHSQQLHPFQVRNLWSTIKLNSSLYNILEL